MDKKEAILLLKQYQGYAPMEYGNILKHSFDLTDETVDTLLSALSVNSIGKPLTLWELENMEGQKVLLYRMKSTEPLELGTVKQRGDVLGDAGMLAYHELYLETWVAFSYQAQEKPDFDKPLALEQLRGMDDQPVKVKNLRYAESGLNTGVVTMCDPNDSDNGVYVGCTFFCIKDYGKIWLAYAYPPAHIDREVWKGCDFCQKELDDYPYVAARGDFSESDTCYEPSYCPICGKPLTPKSWAEQEKRPRKVNQHG